MKNAFTLLEVLITLAIMGIIFFTVFGVYNHTLTLTESFNSYVEINQMAQAIIDITTKDIQSAYYQKSDNSTEANQFSFTTSSEDMEESSEDVNLLLSLATTSDLSFNNIFPASSINLVKYLLKKHNELYSLIRKQKQIQQTKWQSLELADNIKNFTLRFINHAGQEFEEWNSEDKDTYGSELPALVKVKLELKLGHLRKEFEYFIPVEGWSVQND
jgi:type II secretion system protein J